MKKNLSVRIFRRSVILLLVSFFNLVAGISAEKAAPPVPDILNCEMAQVSVYNTGDEARWWMGWVQADNNLPTQHFVYELVEGWVESHEWVTITVYFADIPYCPDTDGMVARISTFDEPHGSRIDDTRLENALHCSCPATPTDTPTPTATNTPPPTNTPVSSNTPHPTNTSVVTKTPSSPLDTPTPTITTTGTGSPTLTETPTPTDTSTVTQIPTIPTSLTLTLTHTPVTAQVANSGPTVLKTVDDDDVIVGDEVTFTLILTNNIDQTVNNVIVTDPIPPFFDIVRATSTKGRVAIDESVNTISQKIQKLKPYEVITITIVARVNDIVPFESEVSNTVNLTYSIDDSVSSESSNTVSLLVGRESAKLGPAFKSLAYVVNVMSGLFGTFICGHGIWMRRRHAGRGLRSIVAGLMLLLVSVGFYYTVVTLLS